MLGLCILAFSLGVVVISFGAVTFQRLHLRYYRSFTLQFTGCTLILLAEGIRTYDLVTNGALNPASHVVQVVLSALGNGLLGYALPLFSLDLTSAPVTARRTLVHGLLAALLAAVGCVKELSAGPTAYIANYAALFAVYAYGSIILFRGIGRIKDPALQRLTRRFLLLAVILALPGLAQAVVKYLPDAPLDIRQYPLVQIVYYLASIGLILSHTVRTPQANAAAGGCALPVDFVMRFNISPRECEIISALEQGISNRTLAETLFISAQTVKNHIYHIYQKTGVKNKVQLINLIRTFGP
jgi:DNA-binding CsgD family transcriptional regulator